MDKTRFLELRSQYNEACEKLCSTPRDDEEARYELHRELEKLGEEMDDADPRPRVYLVYTGEYPEDRQVRGVFFTEDAAKAFITRNGYRFECPEIEEERVLDGAGPEFVDALLE